MAFGQRENLKNIARIAKVDDRRKIVPDWTTIGDRSIFFNPRDQTYNIVIETSHESASKDPEEQNRRLSEAREIGFPLLIQHYNKVDGTPNVTENDPEWFVPERPNPPGCVVFPMRVRVQVRKEVFDLIPFKEDTQEEEPLPVANKELTFVSAGFRDRILDLVDKLDGYQAEVQKFEGKLQGFDFAKESSRARKTIGALETFLSANARVLRDEIADLLIFGIDENFKLLYVVMDQGNGLERLTFGFDLLRLSSSTSNPQTISFLSKLDSIERFNGSWTEFLNTFAIKSFEVIASTDTTAKNKKEPLSESRVKAELKRIDSKTIKTEEEKEAEDTTLLDPRIKQTLASVNETKTEFVGDTVLGDFGSLLEEINSLEDVFGSALNKVNLRTIVQQAIKCLSDRLPLDEVQKILDRAKCIAELLKLPCDEFILEIQEKFGIDFFEIADEFLSEELEKCFNALAEEEKQEAFARISERTGIPVTSVQQFGDINTRITIESLGIDGERIVRAVCEGNREQLISFVPDISLPELPRVDLEAVFPQIEPPTITLPDNLPTTDIMAAISAQVQQAILEALTTALVEMLRGVLQDIVDNCGDVSDLDFGEVDFDDFISNATGVSVDADGFPEVKGGFIGNLASKVDLGNIPDVVTALGGLLDDLSGILTPQEVGDLLNGNPNTDTLLAVNCLVGEKHQALAPVLGESPAAVEDLFLALGNSIDKRPLIQQIATQRAFGPVKDICDLPELEIRKPLLENKGLTCDQIDDQIAKARQRKLDRIAELADLLEGDVLDGVVPPVFCKAGESSGLVPRDPPSLQFMLDRTINTIYDGVRMSFDQEIASFSTTITENAADQGGNVRVVPKKTTFIEEDGTPREIDNPEFLRLAASGVPGSDDLDELTIEGSTPEDPLAPNGTKSFVAKGLKQNLEAIETDNRLFQLTASNGRTSFIIPSEIDPTQLIQDITDSGLQVDEESLRNITPTEYLIDYQPLLEEGRDRYIMAVRSKTGDEIITLFRNERSAELLESVSNFIENENLNLIDDVTQQESYFSKLVSNIWRGGATIFVNGQEVGKPEYGQGVVRNPRQIRTLQTAFRREFTGERFYQLFRDTFSNLSKKISRSSMFRSDILSLVDFVPERTPGCDPHLLDLQGIKNKMIEDYRNSECEDDFAPNTDGLGKPELNPLEQSGISGAVQTTIRLYIIELLLRSIFVLSELKITDVQQVDDVLVSFFTTRIQEEIQSLDEIYRVAFDEQLVRAFNERDGESTEDPQVALEFFAKEQLKSVIERLSLMIGTEGEIDLHRVNVEKWIPLFDVARERGLTRFVTPNSNAADLSEIIQRTTQRTAVVGPNTTFDLTNGNFILERYIRIQDKEDGLFSERSSSQRKPNRVPTLFGVCHLDEWSRYLLDIYDTPGNTNLNLSDHFDSWRYGLRLVYVPPTNTQQFTLNPQRQRIFDDVLGNGSELTEARNKDKSFEVFEQITLPDVQGQPQVLQRRIHSFPIVSVEIEEDLNSISFDAVAREGSMIPKWEEVANQLVEQLLNSPEYDFLFRYCFPLDRMISLAMLYNITYMSGLQKLNNLFRGTKQQLRSVFEALLNAGDYRYEDQFVQQKGGNAGAMAEGQNNIDTSNDIEGQSLAALAFRTPFLILKGIAELTDPNISLSKKIVDKAKENGVNIPIQLVSIAQRPMNVIPPPVGTGAPLTPLGFAYLGFDIEGIFNEAKGKEVKRDSLASEAGVNFDLATQALCNDEEEE